eukprot:6844983-Pyramimonas_sp.AAC.1
MAGSAVCPIARGVQMWARCVRLTQPVWLHSHGAARIWGDVHRRHGWTRLAAAWQTDQDGMPRACDFMRVVRFF